MSLTKLEADMNVISNLSIPLFTEDVETIQKLSDEPNDVDGLTAAELKAKFDKAGVLIKEYLNDTLVPQLSDTVAEADVRAAAEQERMDNENIRVDNETERIDAENARIKSENDRSFDESQRVLAENERVSAEAARQQAEEARAETTNGIVAQATEKAEEAAKNAAIASEAAQNAEESAANIGAHGEEVSATLLASGWSGSGPYVQTVSVPGVNENSFGNIGIPVSATDDQRAAAKDASMYLSAVETGFVTITADGEKPSIDIPIVVQFGMVIDGGTPSGDPGQAATFEIVSTETVEAGQPASATETEDSTPQARKYKLSIPKGQTGPQGPAGPALAVTNTAAVGQTVKITAVDEAGQPTEWEAVEFPAGGEKEWGLISSGEVTDEVTSLEFSNLSKYKELFFQVYVPFGSNSAVNVIINGSFFTESAPYFFHPTCNKICSLSFLLLPNNTVQVISANAELNSMHNKELGAITINRLFNNKETIESIAIEAKVSGVIFLTGTTYSLYGR